jgi:DNA (cytosine-5)-methyltransferase 1
VRGEGAEEVNAIYNEIDPFAAQWLDNLVAAGHIAAGRVDRRSIADLKPADVAGPGQRHFFAGIGGWSYALRLAGIADAADIWTGSCPCQPFSDAGKGLGIRDPRHLWPAWFELIRECRPPTVFGEQVASRDGLAWLDIVRSDLEGCGYAVGASDLCAASVGAPHIRQRLYFVARLGNACSARSRRDARAVLGAEGEGEGEGRQSRRVADVLVDAGTAHVVAIADDESRTVQLSQRKPRRADAEASALHDGSRTGAPDPWRDVEWLECTDGKSRPIEPGLEPLAPRVSGRVVVRRSDHSPEDHEYVANGALAGFGNAIVPQVAAVFIEAAIAASEEVK